MFFSILITYRDREVHSLARCLNSLAQQSYQDYEVIFVNYGSQTHYTEQVLSLLKAYPAIKYIYSETQGLLWNRLEALLLGLSQARGEYIIAVDIDFIFMPPFLESIQKICLPKRALRYIVHYLPADFKALDDLSQNAEKLCAQLEKSGPGAFGAIIAHREEAFLKVGNYGEKYQIWGKEDQDLVEKFKKLGLTLVDFDEAGARVFHQWHAKDAVPKGWLDVIERYFQSRQQMALPNEGFVQRKPLEASERPARQLYLDQHLHPANQVHLQYPKLEAWMALCKKVDNLKQGDYVYIQQDFAPIPLASPSRLGKYMHRINAWLEYWGLSYRVTTLSYHETEFLTADEVYDLLVYFVWHFEKDFEDYYLVRKGDQIFFGLVK